TRSGLLIAYWKRTEGELSGPTLLLWYPPSAPASPQTPQWPVPVAECTPVHQRLPACTASRIRRLGTSQQSRPAASISAAPDRLSRSPPDSPQPRQRALYALPPVQQSAGTSSSENYRGRYPRTMC